jgi:ribokinase
MPNPDPILATVGGLTVDTIVSGTHVSEGVAGGNALYSALGARLWQPSVSMVSFVGEDYPAEVLDQLGECGIATSSVARLPGVSIRLWILYERHGRRQIVYQGESASLDMLATVLANDPMHGGGTRQPLHGVHVAALPVALQRLIVPQAKDCAPVVTVDSIEATGNVGGDLASYLDDGVLDGVTVFMPSAAEYTVLTAAATEEHITAGLAARGVQALIVKNGSAGVAIHDLVDGRATHVGAYPVKQVRDPTGAGDAFCGGFLAMYCETGDPVEAAVAGVVSASFVIEQVGAMHMLHIDPATSARRADWVRRRVTTKEIP